MGVAADWGGGLPWLIQCKMVILEGQALRTELEEEGWKAGKSDRGGPRPTHMGTENPIH